MSLAPSRLLELII